MKLMMAHPDCTDTHAATSAIPILREPDDSGASCMIAKEVSSWWQAVMPGEERRDAASIATVLGLDHFYSKLSR